MVDISFLATIASLTSLTALEILLGIDNVIFLSILAAKLPEEKQATARRLGLLFAVATRLILLSTLSWVMSLGVPFKLPFVTVSLSGRDLILIAGGLFLMAKSTVEIHDKLEGSEGDVHRSGGTKNRPSFAGIVAQIAVLDMVFSLDSVITAVAMSGKLWVMMTAVVLSTGVMLLFSDAICRLVQRHPTIKVLALAFLLLIGLTLVADGLHEHIPRGYLYFALAFSVAVELINLRVREATVPVKLRHTTLTE
jgi:predicted tellurium resistance membrane protein TerC